MKPLLEFVLWTSLLLTACVSFAPPEEHQHATLLDTLQAVASGASYAVCSAAPDGTLTCVAASAPPNNAPQCALTNVYPCWVVVK